MKHGRYSQKHIPKELRKIGLRFVQHRHNAEVRGVEWRLTFEEWWGIWERSGRWEKRGCRFGCYCMCRLNDEGPYAVDNVFIDLATKNVQFGNNPKKTLPVGVRKQNRGGYYAARYANGKCHHLGTFPTIEQAHSAYLDFTPPS